MKQLLKRLKEEELSRNLQKTLNEVQVKGFSIYDNTNSLFFKYGIWSLILLAGAIVFLLFTTP